MTNQPNLFDVPESLSPKEAWKRKHGIVAAQDTGSVFQPWQAWQEKYDDETCEVADTEEEALWKLSQKLGIEFYK